MFELSQVRCFIAVAEEKHFGRAAERLHMSQPPLSRQLQALEQHLGAILVARGNRVADLTPAGVSFLKDARRLIKLAEEAQSSVTRIIGGVSGSLAVGFTSASSYSFLPKLVTCSREILPNIQLRLHELISVAQVEGLMSLALDVGFLRLPVDRNLFRCLCVDRDRMVLALPAGHRLTALESVPVEQLNGEAMIMYMPDESQYHNRLLTNAFHEGDTQPCFVQHARETHTILGLVGCGVGLAIVPEAAVRLCPARVEIRPLVTRQPLMSELHMVWRADQDNPTLRSFQRAMEAHFPHP